MAAKKAGAATPEYLEKNAARQATQFGIVMNECAAKKTAGKTRC